MLFIDVYHYYATYYVRIYLLLYSSLICTCYIACYYCYCYFVSAWPLFFLRSWHFGFRAWARPDILFWLGQSIFSCFCCAAGPILSSPGPGLSFFPALAGPFFQAQSQLLLFLVSPGPHLFPPQPGPVIISPTPAATPEHGSVFCAF